MKKAATLVLLITIVGILIPSCAKEKDTTPATTTTNTAPHDTSSSTSSPPDAILSATQGGGGVVHSATALFIADSQMVSAGSVSINGLALDSLFPGFYTISSNNSALDLSSGAVAWHVAGANGFTGFDRDLSGTAFPAVGNITSDNLVHKASGYTFSCASMAGADSVLFSVGFLLHKMVAGNATSCTFSASELAALSNGDNWSYISGYKYTTDTIGGKRIRFDKIRSSAATLTVSD